MPFLNVLSEIATHLNDSGYYDVSVMFRFGNREKEKLRPRPQN